MSEPSAYPAKRMIFFGIVTVACLIFGFGSWAYFTELSGAIVVNGALKVESNRHPLQHPDGGVIEDIMVSEGDVVSAGDVLIRFDPTTLNARLSVVETQYFDQFARIERLKAESSAQKHLAFPNSLTARAAENPDVLDQINGQLQIFTSRNHTLATQLSQLDKQKIQIERQIEGHFAQKHALEMQSALLEEEIADKLTLLEKGLTQASSIASLKRENYAIKGQIGALEATIAQAKLQITQNGLEQTNLKSSRQEKAIVSLREAQGSLAQLREERQLLQEQISRLTLYAPADGTVLGLRYFTKKAVIEPAKPILHLIPSKQPLIVSTKIRPQDINEAHIGQQVSLHFDSLGIVNKVELAGNITHISADTFLDQSSGQHYYPAEITLADGEIHSLPEHLRLIPGMPVTAFIQTQSQTPLDYLTKPLTTYFEKAMRES